jgi:hypothetical protein
MPLSKNERQVLAAAAYSMDRFASAYHSWAERLAKDNKEGTRNLDIAFLRSLAQEAVAHRVSLTQMLNKDAADRGTKMASVIP